MKDGFVDTLREYKGPSEGGDLFEREPVPLDVFLYDRAQLNIGIQLSEKQFDVLRFSTQIYRIAELEVLGWEVLRNVSEIYLQWGKGSGKDLISMLTAARIVDLLLCLKSPQKYFELSPFSPIDMINMAFNADQAKFNFYEPMRKMIGRSLRFKNLADDKEKHIEFAKSIYAHSGHSDEEAAEGKSLILAVLDEISAFKTKQEFSRVARQVRAPKHSYESLIDAMKSSRQSRFDTGKLIAISYPRYKGCPIQQLYNMGLKDNKERGSKSTIYVSFGFTWEVNPIKRKEQFEDEYRRNPGLVEAKYKCNPSQAEDSYIKNLDIIEETFPDIKEELIPHTIGDYPQLKSHFKCSHNFACSAHIDLGLSKCGAGFALTHQYDVRYEKVINADTGESELIELPLVGIDIMTSFRAPVNGEVDFSEIRRFLFALRNAGFHVSIVSYDQWNSAGERQILEKAGFNFSRRSVDIDRSMYDDVVIMMTEKRLTGGYATYRSFTFAGQDMRVCIIKEELQGLVEVRGKRIDHRPTGSKDEADSLAGSVRGAIEFGLWRCGESVPKAEQLQAPKRAYEAEKGEVAIIERIKAQNGSTRMPGNLGFRGTPQNMVYRGNPR